MRMEFSTRQKEKKLHCHYQL